jgi:hypothetical protein
MEAISNAENDSAKAFAGLTKMNENIDRENAILSSIAAILTANGL